MVPFAKLRGAMTQKVILGKLRVFYETSGPHAVSAEDANGNGVPDHPEDVAAQAMGAWQLWTCLGFADPLQTPRYAGAAWIDVHLLSKETIKTNGVAYDELQHFSRPGDAEGTTSLCFDVATSVKAPANLTPAHEMFHLLQNCVCFFKNRWFTEGTARWSEKALGKGGLPEGIRRTVWPPEPAAMEAIFAGAYDTAATYWGPLLASDDEIGTLPEERLPRSLLDAHYANGEPVLKDRQLTGWELIREILTALDAEDDLVFRERKLDRWSEVEQRSDANNAILHRVVQEVMAKRHAGTR